MIEDTFKHTTYYKMRGWIAVEVRLEDYSNNVENPGCCLTDRIGAD